MESKDEVDRLLEDGAEVNIIKDVEVTLRDEVCWLMFNLGGAMLK